MTLSQTTFAELQESEQFGQKVDNCFQAKLPELVGWQAQNHSTCGLVEVYHLFPYTEWRLDEPENP